MSETDEDNILLLLVHSPELLLENLKHLMEKNKIQMEKYGWYMVRYPTALITTIFEICDLYEKNIFVKYTAVEILMRYLSIHYMQLKERCSRREAMASLNEHNQNNNYLLIFTSVRIADKLQSMHEHMTAKEMVKALQKHAIPITIRRIKELERDMLKTINFDINFVIIPEYVEVLILSLNLLFHMPQADIGNLKLTAVELLDTIYPHIESLYQQMWECASEENKIIEEAKKNYSQIKADYFNLAVGIIIAAAHKVSTAMGTDVLSYLSSMIGNDMRVMTFYAMSVIQLYYSIKQFELSEKNSS